MANQWEEQGSSGNKSLPTYGSNGDAPPPDKLPEAGVEASSTYSSGSEPYGESLPSPAVSTTATVEKTAEIVPAANTPKAPVRTPPPPPPPPSSDDEEAGDEEEGMLRMSFMEHLEELRTRLIRAILGLAVAFVVSMFFSNDLWIFVQEPAVGALKHLGVNPPELVYISPMEAFNIIWLKMPALVSLFIGSPWVVYQLWAFISPGLYKREKRWAVPFILCTAGLFIAGGCFAYFVAFRYGLEFLLGIGPHVGVRPTVSIDYYFDLFVNVTLGIGLVFEMPVIIFFLTLLRIASPRFLLRHSRYAILGITILAAVVTPTPDVFNMMIFAVPMVMLFFVGVFASYLLVLRRERKKFPWRNTILILLGMLLLSAGIVAYFVYRYHYHFIAKWPYLVK
ncbi:MAG: twin-arginine translocase subunit TatC [Acidobacteriaceae bacterium]|nr:twin-arginine translocase subunit TatC [Acidobacteriaceae bacterium]MBV9306090.1 twin-arginine translocase subunit TatC [Acidobacteriaceae bacterium]